MEASSARLSNDQPAACKRAVPDDLLGSIPEQWLEEFEAAARRPLETRIKYGFVKTYKPVLDDATYRSWESTAEYRRWCEDNLPSWLGYGRV
jgi:hypothetical protein